MNYFQEGKAYRRAGGDGNDYWRLREVLQSGHYIYFHSISGEFFDVVPYGMTAAQLLESMRLNGFDFVVEKDNVWTFRCEPKPPIPLIDFQIGEIHENVKALLVLLTEHAGLHLTDSDG